LSLAPAAALAGWGLAALPSSPGAERAGLGALRALTARLGAAAPEPGRPLVDAAVAVIADLDGTLAALGLDGALVANPGASRALGANAERAEWPGVGRVDVTVALTAWSYAGVARLVGELVARHPVALKHLVLAERESRLTLTVFGLLGGPA
jgi:hypothetical protein